MLGESEKESRVQKVYRDNRIRELCEKIVDEVQDMDD